MNKLTQRINLEMPVGTRDRLSAIADTMGATTMSEAFRRMLGLAELIQPHLNAGGVIVLKAKDGTEQAIRIL